MIVWADFFLIVGIPIDNLLGVISGQIFR